MTNDPHDPHDPHDFEESLLSGYLDDQLTQGDAQRVRIHLEDCDRCRATMDELESLRSSMAGTRFAVPDDQWDERPRGRASSMLRWTGWIVGLAWLGLLVFLVAREVTRDSESLADVLVVFGLWAAGGLLFLSVLIDRLRTYRTDPYRHVKK